MNQEHPSFLKRLAGLGSRLPGGALIGALFGAGLAMPVHAALGLTASVWDIPLLCVGFAAALTLTNLRRWLRCVGGIALTAAAVLWLLAQARTLSNLPAALTLLLGGESASLRLFSGPLTVLLAAGFTAVGFTLAQRGAGFYPALSMTMVVLLGVWFYGDRSKIGLCLPALLALELLYALAAELDTPLRRVVPMALAAMLLAFLLLPAQKTTLPVLEDAATRLRDMVYEYFFFTEPRTTYSLQGDGYMPLGAERLGGPADPNDRPVMEVHTQRSLLLRGAIRDTYTGVGWTDSASGRRYLYIDPRFTSLRDSILDARRPDADARRASPLFSPQAVGIVMAGPGVSTLFVPQRFSGLRPGEDMVPYFNASSEVFITRDTAPGDTYGMDAYPFTADTPGVADLLKSPPDQGDDPQYAEVAARYLDVPQVVDPGVRALAAQLTEAAATPYEKAMALTRHLRATYPYTLNQHTPPSSRDFVSWFLLVERQGYCTSFATSLAVLGRIVGLPTRYVEGYSARPGADGVAHVTGQQAHAWVEIYFPHFGWLPFDPTPALDSSGGEGAGDQQQPPEGGGDTDETPPPDQSSEPTPTPSPEDQPPSPSPEPEPTLPPDDGETPKPPPPSPTPEPPEPPPPEEEPPKPPWKLLLPLVLALLIGGLIWRLHRTNPFRVAARQAEDDARLLVWYRALTQSLAARGLVPETSESPLAYFERVEDALTKAEDAVVAGRKRPRAGAPVSLMPTAAALCSLRYGARAVEPDAFRATEAAYRALWKRLSLPKKIAVLWRRVLRGLGGIRQVP